MSGPSGAGAPASPAALEPLTGEQAAALAQRYGLTPVGGRPPLRQYMPELWARRHFISQFARARRRSENADSRLGPIWELLNPILTSAVYYLIFGVILSTTRGVDNFLAFLVTGVFVFQYSSQSLTAGSRAISGNLNLVRTLHFPRATLPLAVCLGLLYELAISLVVLAAIVLLTGEPITWNWLLVIPAITLQTLFNVGLAFTFARLNAASPDVGKLLPFITRIWMYTSGVFYSIQTYTQNAPEIVRIIMLGNPAAVYMELVRDALLTSFSVPVWTWWVGAGWAAVALVGGFLFFWRAEGRYGRG